MINIFIVDDHDFFIQGLSMAFAQARTSIRVVGTANSCSDALRLLQNLEVDVLLLDILMPEMNGIECCRRVKMDFPGIKVIGLTGEVDPVLMMELWRQSADAILLKSDGLDDVISAIESVMKNKKVFSKNVPNFMVYIDQQPDGVPRLTPRELQVLQLLGTGLARKEVAQELNLSMYSVGFHCKNLIRKFNGDKIHVVIAEAKKNRIIT
ncbi:MAG: response regulator transcription factor [Bacteroidales bacterium]|jgi:DNA-binding NarL/FixJ family response regulator